jgi:hypothetical protein
VQRLLREQGQSYVQNVWRAGAETPPPDLDDNSGSDLEDQAVTRSRADTSLGETAPSLATDERPNERREPKLMSPVGTAAAPLGAERRRKLQTTLDDLIACRRLLDAAMSETPVSHD